MLRNSWFWFALILFMVPVALVGCYIWSAGLDLSQPSSARDWINVCARGREAVYCKAAAEVIAKIDGPIIFLHPNRGDDEIKAEVDKFVSKEGTNRSIESLVKANIFVGSRLKSGSMKTLDGQYRKVTCLKVDNFKSCRIDKLEGSLKNQPQNDSDGSVYSVVGAEGDANFLLPPDK